MGFPYLCILQHPKKTYAMKKLFYSALFLCLSTGAGLANPPKFADIFNSGMVLQREAPIRVWGSADPGTRVEVSILRTRVSATADEKGAWTTELPAMKAGGPFTLSVSAGDEKTTLEDILVGEVWFAGGQSNMEFSLRSSKDGDKAVAEAQNPYIRVAYVPAIPYEGAQPCKPVPWRHATTDYVRSMSAVGYYFAKELQETLNVPVGIICLYKGNTTASVWMSREKLLSDPLFAPIAENYDRYMAAMAPGEYERQLADYKEWNTYYQSHGRQGKRLQEPMGPKNFRRPSGLFANVLRVAPMTIRGVIFYQGEANTTRAAQYQKLFPALIEEWREIFRQPDMPFYFVQVPELQDRSTFPELRWAQLQSWLHTPNTGMAMAMGYGEPDQIHPIQKQPVGHRLALIALAKNYGYDLTYSGPIYKGVSFEDGKAVLTFDFVCGGLASADGKPLRSFTICGEDQQFVPAEARIEGDKVVVWSDRVTAPVAVRYSWSVVPDGNLINTDSLPASPFRTDDFRLKTEGKLHDTYRYVYANGQKIIR